VGMNRKSNGRVNPRENGRAGGRVHSGAKGNGRAPASAVKSAYDHFKEFGGKRYTGMQVGRGHKWHYDAGDWTEKKVTPDKWEFTYSVAKRRKGNAPEGSGAPVGTAYHWYILADQKVTKLDANSYMTEMAGLKYKLAHKRADRETWSDSARAQKRRLVQLLREMISELEESPDELRVAPNREPPAPRGAGAARGPLKRKASTARPQSAAAA
jgi:hypothetical protein